MDNQSMELYQDRYMHVNRSFFFYKFNCFLPGITVRTVSVRVDLCHGFPSPKDQAPLTDLGFQME